MPITLKENRIALWGPNCVLYPMFQDIPGITSEGWTIVGAPTIVESPYGRALRFDGTNDWVTVPDVPYLRFNGATEDFSCVAMVLISDLSDNRNILDKREASDDGYRFLVSTTGQILASVDAIDITSAMGVVALNTWTLVGFTIDKSANGQMYANGQPSGAAIAIGGEVMDTTIDLYIGRRSYGDATRWQGDIDSIVLFNRALSDADHLQIYNQYIGNA